MCTNIDIECTEIGSTKKHVPKVCVLKLLFTESDLSPGTDLLPIPVRSDFFHNRPPVGQNQFLPVIERLLSTYYCGI